MKIIDCVQGSPEWFAARCGIPTASNFDKIITIDGKPSKQREKYLYRLAGERITQKPEASYQNESMARGVEMEAEARTLYELMTGKTVGIVGVCSQGNYSASPDGLVNGDGLLEIKCPLLSTHVSYLLQNELPSEYFQQVQGQLFVTERKYCDFMSYYPAIKPFIITVKPDKKFHKALKTELDLFCKELEEITNKLKEEK